MGLAGPACYTGASRGSHGSKKLEQRTKAALGELNEQLAMVIKERDEAVSARDEARRVADLTGRESARMEDELASLRSRVKDYPAQMDELRTKLKEQIVRCDVTEKERDALAAAAESAKEKAALDKDRAVLDAERRAQAELEKTRQADLVELKRLLDEKAALESELARVRTEKLADIEAFRHENAALKAENQSLRGEAAKAKTSRMRSATKAKPASESS